MCVSVCVCDASLFNTCAPIKSDCILSLFLFLLTNLGGRSCFAAAKENAALCRSPRTSLRGAWSSTSWALLLCKPQSEIKASQRFAAWLSWGSLLCVCACVRVCVCVASFVLCRAGARFRSASNPTPTLTMQRMRCGGGPRVRASCWLRPLSQRGQQATPRPTLLVLSSALTGPPIPRCV